LTQSGLLSGFKLDLDVPAECAKKILLDDADIGLVPVAMLPEIKDHRIISNFCIGAEKNVKSVLLLANSDLHGLKTVFLDTDSRTSVNLVKILANKFWGINPTWMSISECKGDLSDDEGMVLIGDKTFGLCRQYSFCYDLAGEWVKFTGLPFVFAAWVTKKPLTDVFEKAFQSALSWGVDNREKSIGLAEKLLITEHELISYLKEDISYLLDERKIAGLSLFLKYLSEEKA
jgi:chorismate dehydratase